MFSSIKVITFAILSVTAGHALAESHTVTFANNCGHGTPTLIQGPKVLSTGGAFTSPGPFKSFIAYLQTGNCGFNGEDCTIVEGTLVNPTSPGSGSSVDISLVPPHAFSVTTGFGYVGACAPAGADCTNANCPTAFHKSSDTSK
ncbi:hypothetical protein B0H14DRAFT_3511186 [Mycena olivaceomarginata]|nr:hypothetical protein B0H14DRAFT_3511186 [Mycena olivaceomarginata]